MVRITKPASRLIQSVKDADAPLFQRRQDFYSRRDNDVSADLVILIGPIDQIQFVVVVGQGKDSRTIELVEDFRRLKWLKP